MAAGRKTGGRVAGTPNKATKQIKDLLERVFSRVLSEKVGVYRKNATTGEQELVQLSFEDVLVERMLTFQLDEKFLQFLFVMHAGRPTQQVEHDHRGHVTLEQLIAGTVPEDTPEDGS